MGRERRKWTPEEDELLRQAVKKGKRPPSAGQKLEFCATWPTKHLLILSSYGQVATAVVARIGKKRTRKDKQGLPQTMVEFARGRRDEGPLGRV